MAQEAKILWIDYTNHKGARRIRAIYPTKLIWGATEYHPKQQWLLEAVDVEDQNKYKLFSMEYIHAMGQSKEALENRPVPTEPPTLPA